MSLPSFCMYQHISVIKHIVVLHLNQHDVQGRQAEKQQQLHNTGTVYVHGTTDHSQANAERHILK